MASLAQKHKEFSRFARAYSNLLFFRGQRNRWVPHDRLLHVGGARSSSTYKSTEPPTVSTPSELLSKQLISVLVARLLVFDRFQNRIQSCEFYTGVSRGALPVDLPLHSIPVALPGR